MNICIVIPAYNEAQHIGPIIEALHSMKHDVVVVDDGSTDSTGDIARKMGAVVIRQGHKNGKGYSLRKGFEYVKARDYDGLIAMDGDGQHDVGDIGRFIEAAGENKVSIIIGNRMANSKDMSLIRYCTNRFMSWLISMACKTRIPDSQCGFRYIACDVLRAIELSSRDYEIESEILIKASKKGFAIGNVPVLTIYSDEKSHINPFLDTIRFFVYLIKEFCSKKKP